MPCWRRHVAHGCRLVHASTSEVYGDVPEARINEGYPLNAYSPYAASKLAADGMVQSYIHTYGMDATVLRLFNTYGPGQHFEKVIPMFICSALCKLPLPIQGDGSASRDWNHVEDVSARFEQLLHSRLPVAVCNLASGERMAVHELADQIMRLSGSPHVQAERYAAVAARIGTPEVRLALDVKLGLESAFPPEKAALLLRSSAYPIVCEFVEEYVLAVPSPAFVDTIRNRVRCCQSIDPWLQEYLIRKMGGAAT